MTTLSVPQFSGLSIEVVVDNQFRVVAMDPAWHETGGGKIKRGADKHYETIRTKDLPGVIRSCEHWANVSSQSHLYMWVTNSYLKDGLWLMENLGYRYVTNLVWAKRQFGLGQ